MLLLYEKLRVELEARTCCPRSLAIPCFFPSLQLASSKKEFKIQEKFFRNISLNALFFPALPNNFVCCSKSLLSIFLFIRINWYMMRDVCFLPLNLLFEQWRSYEHVLLWDHTSIIIASEECLRNAFLKIFPLSRWLQRATKPSSPRAGTSTISPLAAIGSNTTTVNHYPSPERKSRKTWSLVVRRACGASQWTSTTWSREFGPGRVLPLRSFGRKVEPAMSRGPRGDWRSTRAGWTGEGSLLNRPMGRGTVIDCQSGSESVFVLYKKFCKSIKFKCCSLYSYRFRYMWSNKKRHVWDHCYNFLTTKRFLYCFSKDECFWNF